MTSGPATLLFLGVIPVILIYPLWALSKEYVLIHKAIISIAVFAISFGVFLLAIVFGEDAIVRTQKGSHHKRSRVMWDVIVSGVLALVLAIYIHWIDLWNWLMTGLLFVGCFILSVGIGCLLWILLDALLGSKGSYRGGEIRKYKP